MHPALFALLYKVCWQILRFLHPLIVENLTSAHLHAQVLQVAMVDTSWTVAKAPQVMQAGFAAMTDLYVYKLTLLLFGQNIARCGRRAASRFLNDGCGSPKSFHPKNDVQLHILAADGLSCVK